MAPALTAREFKDVFEIGGVPAFNQFYYYGIFPWHAIYKGYYKPWHWVLAPTIAKPDAHRELYRMNLAKAVCAELAGLLWAEKCTINVNLPGWEPTPDETQDKAGRFIHSVLAENAFTVKMQESIEQALALGGCALKLWADGKHDETGAIIPGTEKIKIGYCMADQFVPTSWTNAKITEGVFISRQAKGGYYYTKLEWHKWNGETYVISNDLYRADRKAAPVDSQDILGIRCPLIELYPALEPETEINGLTESLFSYFRTPIANNIDDNSPLGVSIYANSMETLHAIDIVYDSLVREFRLGKKRIIVPARAVRKVVEPETGIVRRFFDATDETYEALASDDPNDLKIIDNSVSLRVDEHVAALNAHLLTLCEQLGFSASTFSFDVHGGLKTATEVVAENSKTYKTVANCQNAIEPALRQLVHNIFAIAVLYDMTFEGERVASWFPAGISGGYECNIYWDDGVVQDRTSKLNEGILMLGNGAISKKRFRMDYLGMTEAQADAEEELIRAENTIQPLAIDKMFVE